jgi:hypothetical protein
MPKKIVNIGTSANDRTGDNLRSAFLKINDNFDELYTELGLNDENDTTLNLGNFVFENNTVRLTNANNDDSTATQIEIAQPVRIESDLTVGGDIVPNTANGGNLGSPAKPFRSLFVSNSTIFLGNVPLSLEPGTNELQINNVPISQTITYADIPGVPTDVSDLTDSDGLLGGGGGDTGDITFVNNIISAPDDDAIRIEAKDDNGDVRAYFKVDPADGQAEMRALSSPTRTNFSLADGDWVSAQWIANGGTGYLEFTNAPNIISYLVDAPSNLYIRINGGAPVSKGSGSGSDNDISVDTGSDFPPSTTVVTTVEFYYMDESRIEIDYDSDIDIYGDQLDISIESTESVYVQGRDVEISASGTLKLQNYADDQNIEIVTDGDNEQQTWVFGVDGDLTAPGNITTGTNGGRFVQDCGDGITSIRWINIDENNDAELLRFYTGDPGEESGDAERAQIRLNWQNADQSGLTIKSFDQDSNEEHDWEFRGDGSAEFPGAITAAGAITITADENATFTSSSGYGQISGDNGAELYHESGSVFNNVTVSSSGIAIQSLDTQPGVIASSDISLETGELGLNASSTVSLRTNYAGNTKTWLFDDTGDLTIPGDIRSEGNINIDINLSDSTLRRWRFGEDGNTEFPGDIAVAGESITVNNIVLSNPEGSAVFGVSASQLILDPTGVGQSVGDIRTAVRSTAGKGYDMTYTAGSITGDATQAADVYLRGGANGILGSFGGDVYIDGGVGTTAGNVFIGANSGQVNIEASDLLAKQGQFLYISSKHSGGTVTNATFTYDADASGSVKQKFFGTTEFGNNGEVPVVDFTGATVTGLTAEVARNIESDNDVNITVNNQDSSSYTWNFGQTGDLILPVDGDLIIGEDGRWIKDCGGSSGTTSMRWINVPVDNDSTQLIRVYSGDPAGDGDSNERAQIRLNWLDEDRSGLTIRAYDRTDSEDTVTHNWTFQGDGSLTLPGDIKSESAINIDVNLSDSTLRRWTFGEDGDLSLPGGGLLGQVWGDGVDTELTLKSPPGDGIDSGYVALGSANEQNYVEVSNTGVVLAVKFGQAGFKTLNFDIAGDLMLPGKLKLAQGGVQEYFQAKADATGVVDHDCALGQIFYHTSPDANWTANFTNLDLGTSASTNLVLVVEQGATPYYPSALQIGGAAQTIKWLGNVTPTPSANKTEIATFTIFNNAGTFTVLGSYNTYG